MTRRGVAMIDVVLALALLSIVSAAMAAIARDVASRPRPPNDLFERHARLAARATRFAREPRSPGVADSPAALAIHGRSSVWDLYSEDGLIVLRWTGFAKEAR